MAITTLRGAAKAWVRFTTITTTTVLASYNISSLTDVGVGTTTINYTTPFSSANYSAVATSRNTATANLLGQVEVFATGSISYLALNGASIVDADVNSFAAFGDQ